MKKTVKYEISDYSKLTNSQLMDKMEMYLGRMTIIEFKRKQDNGNDKLFNSVKQWFSCSLNMYEISKELRTRLGMEVNIDPQLN